MVEDSNKGNSGMDVESILLAVVHISTHSRQQALTRATGFIFERKADNQLFLITNRHVVRDDKSRHFPERLELIMHKNADNLAETFVFSVPLYDGNRQPVWLEGFDSAGVVDVVAITIDSSKLPAQTLLKSFTEDNLLTDLEKVEIGESVRVVGYPLDFHDTLHKLPVMRHAIIASSFSLRFQGNGYFLTDSLLHRGSSGSPVVMKRTSQASGRRDFPWILLGIHSSRLSAVRDPEHDERLNLFAAWYTDVLLTITKLPEK